MATSKQRGTRTSTLPNRGSQIQRAGSVILASSNSSPALRSNLTAFRIPDTESSEQCVCTSENESICSPKASWLRRAPPTSPVFKLHESRMIDLGKRDNADADRSYADKEMLDAMLGASVCSPEKRCRAPTVVGNLDSRDLKARTRLNFRLQDKFENFSKDLVAIRMLEEKSKRERTYFSFTTNTDWIIPPRAFFRQAEPNRPWEDASGHSGPVSIQSRGLWTNCQTIHPERIMSAFTTTRVGT